MKKTFKAVEETWRVRLDRCEILDKTGKDVKTKSIYFSAQIARKFAFLYLILFYIPSTRKAWIPDVLHYFGWKDDDLDTKKRYHHMLYMTIKSFSSDYDLQVEIVRSSQEERVNMPKGYYQYLVIADYGIFNEERLKKLLLDNKSTFEQILDNNALTSNN